MHELEWVVGAHTLLGMSRIAFDLNGYYKRVIRLSENSMNSTKMIDVTPGGSSVSSHSSIISLISAYYYLLVTESIVLSIIAP
jgi:hypothetical protein